MIKVAKSWRNVAKQLVANATPDIQKLNGKLPNMGSNISSVILESWRINTRLKSMFTNRDRSNMQGRELQLKHDEQEQ